MPVGIEEAVGIQEARNPGDAFARQELEEGGQIFGTDVFGR